MNDIHLKEEEIQAYSITGTLPPFKSEHLVSCAECQLQVTAYREIYAHLRHAELPLPLADMEAIVLSHLPRYNGQDKNNNFFYYLIYVMAALAFAGGLVSLLITVGWLFTGSAVSLIVLAALFFTFLLLVQVNILYNDYRKKHDLLNLQNIAT